MNAFLIFCKRHRAQVREKYPHLENRQVTKILGEWWADLPAQQKTSYTELARQYKEAFLRANPDFKWYKIPAQPPRPPPARPSNQKVPRCDPLPTDGAITFGKLADEAQMGGLSTLLSTASTSTSQNPTQGPSTPTTAYVSTPTTSTSRGVAIDSYPLVALSSLTQPSGSSISTSSGPSMSTNASVTTSLSTWSGSVQPVAPTLALDAHSHALTNGARQPTADTPPATTHATQPDTPATMTPPRPPKKRYMHMLDQAKAAPAEDTNKTPTSWSFPKQKGDSGAPAVSDAAEEHHRRVPNGPFSARILPITPITPGVPAADPTKPSVQNTPNIAAKPPLITPINTSLQPLNLTRETKIIASNQDIIDSVVDRKCNEPNFPSSGRSEPRPDYPRFFRPENLHNNNNNNNNNDIDKPTFHQAILNKNGTCDIKFLMSQTIDFVVNKAYDKDNRKTKTIASKSDVAEVNSSVESSEKKEVEGENRENDAKETGDNTNGNSNVKNSNENGNLTQKKRAKEKNPDDTEILPKKPRREGGSGRGRDAARGVDGSGGRSRAPRKLKGKRYEELISEGVLQAPRRARTRNSRWEEAESSGVQDGDDDDYLGKGMEGDDDHDDDPMDDDDLPTPRHDDENGEGLARRGEDGARRGRRQARRLPPNDFDLEARIEALPSLSIDDFTRRKKERKRTSSASSSHASSHSSASSSHTSSSSVHSATTTAPHTTQAALGIVSSSSRIAAQADSTSDPHPAMAATPGLTASPVSTPATGGTTATGATTSPACYAPGLNSTSNCPTLGGVTSTSTTGGFSGGNLSDSEAVSPTPSSSSSSSLTQQHSPTPGTLLVATGSISPGESGDDGPRIGSQRRKARKQAITRHDPANGPLRRDTSVIEPGVLSSMAGAGLAALAEVASSQPSIKL